MSIVWPRKENIFRFSECMVEVGGVVYKTSTLYVAGLWIFCGIIN